MYTCESGDQIVAITAISAISTVDIHPGNHCHGHVSHSTYTQSLSPSHSTISKPQLEPRIPQLFI